MTASERLGRIWEEMMKERDGSARQAEWDCEDGYIVRYTTSRIQGGPLHDKWAVMLYKPTGKGARSGKATEWKCIYKRGFSTRKAARARAEALYYQHSPKRAAAHGRG